MSARLGAKGPVEAGLCQADSLAQTVESPASPITTKRPGAMVHRCYLEDSMRLLHRYIKNKRIIQHLTKSRPDHAM